MFDDRDGSAVVAKQVARPCGARAERPRALKACAEQRASLADVASVRGASRRGGRRAEAMETKRRRDGGCVRCVLLDSLVLVVQDVTRLCRMFTRLCRMVLRSARCLLGCAGCLLGRARPHEVEDQRLWEIEKFVS